MHEHQRPAQPTGSAEPGLTEAVTAPLPDGRLTMDGFARWSLSAVPALPDRPAYVRHQVTAVLHLWELDGIAWAVELVVAELVGNVIRHARTPFNVTLTWDGQLLRGEVSDANPRQPAPVEYVEADATGGRGLHIVDAASSRWGFEPHQQGKTVWFEIAS
jgi:hypothetical protein